MKIFNCKGVIILYLSAKNAKVSRKVSKGLAFLAPSSRPQRLPAGKAGLKKIYDGREVLDIVKSVY